MYPGEDRENGGLIFECRHCNESERADNSCVFRNELSNTVGETAGITQDVSADPTVGGDYEDDIPPMCTMCGQEILCEDCGMPVEEGYLCLEVDDMNSQANDRGSTETQQKLSETLQNLKMKDEGGGGGKTGS